MRTSRAGLDVIKAFEGFRPRYQKLPNDQWIIGYGHLRDEGESVRISLEEAEAILREYDLPPVERLVMDSVLAPLNQNEFDALVSLAFNIGARPFVKSDVVACINSGNRLEAASAFDQWTKARIGGRVQVLDALVRRRATEKALFLKAPGPTPTASSRIYMPLNNMTAEPKALPKPREILVEHTPDQPRVQAETDTTPTLTATEEAAASVRRRLVRIIGEDGINANPSDDSTDGASPEEITAAISALAGETEDQSVSKSVWPQREDLSPPPFMNEVDAGSNIAPESDLLAEPEADPVEVLPEVEIEPIDDLEEVEVRPEDIQRAVEENHRIEVEENGGKWLDALPFLLLSLFGLGFAGYGVASLIQMTPDQAASGSLLTYMPPFLILLGGILFVTMVYYLIRVLMEHSRS